jgi:CBS-domain-containing membrane protein
MRSKTACFVVTVSPDATLKEAAQLMLQYRISGLPVTDSDRAVLSIITERSAASSPRPVPRSLMPDGSHSLRVRDGWRKNTCIRIRAKSASDD